MIDYDTNPLSLLIKQLKFCDALSGNALMSQQSKLLSSCSVTWTSASTNMSLCGTTCLCHIFLNPVSVALTICPDTHTGAVAIPCACAGALLQGVSRDSEAHHHGSL